MYRRSSTTQPGEEHPCLCWEVYFVKLKLVAASIKDVQTIGKSLGVEGLAWLKTKYADANDDWPDVQFHFIGSCVTADRGRSVRYSHGVSDTVWEKYYLPIIDRDCWSIMPVTLRPRSRGYIRLNSADAFDKPIINPNYYSDPYDLAVTIEGIKLALQLSQTSAFKKMNRKFYDKPFPGCEGYPMGTDDYWACWVRSYR
jgi:glucose dehydrogenase (acceptor)